MKVRIAIAAAAAYLVFAIWELAVGGIVLGLVYAAGSAFFVFLTVMEVRRGHRKTAGDRDDPDLPPFGVTIGSAFAGNATSAGTDPGVKETTADVPILAFKRCGLRWSPGGRFALTSLYHEQAIEAEQFAECRRPTSPFVISMMASLGQSPEAHEPPGLHCTCGFYAVMDRSLLEGIGTVTLDVEMSGRVIVCERGYRAQHQRVLRARIEGCHLCGEPITGFAVAIMPPPIAPSMFSLPRPESVRAVCEAHTNPGDVIVAPSIVADRLGVPFEWRAAEMDEAS